MDTLRATVQRVALFAPSMIWGGAEKMFGRLGEGFIECGLSVDLVLATASGPNMEGLHPEIRVVDLGCGRLLRSVWPLARYMDEQRPDVVISTLDHANLVAVWARGLARHSPFLILREANTMSAAARGATDVRDRLCPSLARAFYPRADVVVAVSKGVGQDLVEKVGLPAQMVRVIHNPTFHPEILAQMAEPVDHPWMTDGGPPIVLSLGRLSKQKRYDTLIEAVSKAVQQQPMRLIIFGEGEERGRLESKAWELGIQESVSLPGFRSNPYAYMAHADLYAVSSAYEGFPNTIVEALACGLPVVSTDCPSGPREILDLPGIGSGVYGTLVPVGDAEALAQAIVGELHHERDRQALELRGRSFSVERATRAYLDLMRSGIQRGWRKWQ